MVDLSGVVSDNEFFVTGDFIQGDSNLIRKSYLNPEHAERLAIGEVMFLVGKEQARRRKEGLPLMTYYECVGIIPRVICSYSMSVGGRSAKVLERVFAHKHRVLERKKKYKDDDD